MAIHIIAGNTDGSCGVLFCESYKWRVIQSWSWYILEALYTQHTTVVQQQIAAMAHWWVTTGGVSSHNQDNTHYSQQNEGLRSMDMVLFNLISVFGWFYFANCRWRMAGNEITCICCLSCMVDNPPVPPVKSQASSAKTETTITALVMWQASRCMTTLFR